MKIYFHIKSSFEFDRRFGGYVLELNNTLYLFNKQQRHPITAPKKMSKTYGNGKSERAVGAMVLPMVGAILLDPSWNVLTIEYFCLAWPDGWRPDVCLAQPVPCGIE